MTEKSDQIKDKIKEKLKKGKDIESEVPMPGVDESEGKPEVETAQEKGPTPEQIEQAKIGELKEMHDLNHDGYFRYQILLHLSQLNHGIAALIEQNKELLGKKRE